ncbi:glycoside hydrolase family 92 protein [Pterulicium gracile]|uniref:Glycoside hydrolase family 92 protein n=1 Tax=Pterulicium gracile TaxID=1884261 RepID=A0A5C3QMD0_9AGAR|nr:glycoside hydrolase family 92 protein [Pterula gracilis]
MVAVGMDTDAPGNHAGYDGDPQYNATGFSQLHMSGTGGAVPLSNFKLWPIDSCPNFETCNTTLAWRKRPRAVLEDGAPDDFASPGYFAANLSTNIRVELTSTRRAALHRYTFPPEVTHPRILLDVSNDGQASITETKLKIDTITGRIRTSGQFMSSFGPDRYNAYACADFKGDGYDFDGPTEWGAYKINYPALGMTDIHQHYVSWDQDMGGLETFPVNPDGGPTSIFARVGISLISIDQACKNAESEIPDWDFDRLVEESREQWNDILERFQIEDEEADEDTLSLFYSSLYRTHLTPADYSGENPNWDSKKVPYYDSFYVNWDLYRTLFPIMSLHDPQRFADIVAAMIDIQKHEGWLPEAREAGTKMFVQGGSNADPVLAEFFMKYQKQAKKLGVSEKDLYKALLADAEKQPENWNIQGRQADIYNKLGYVPSDTHYPGGSNTKQVSRTAEYAFNDFTISQVAKALGKKKDAKKYADRSLNFLNVWNPEISLPGLDGSMGMLQPKFENSTWNFTDPRHCSVNDPTKSTCFLNAIRRDGFYEGSPIIYSQYMPHDTATLIELQGGVDKFVERLDFIFTHKYFESTNEPSQQMPFMYHYANRPGLSTQRSRQVMAQYFNTSRNGLPGNDDSGAMGSYALSYMLGLYPLPGTKQYLLSSPYFRKISITNPVLKKTTTFIANNFTGNPGDGIGGNVFVKSVTVDGKPYKSNCYLEWDVFTSGSTVELELTDDINLTCGDGADSLPPSLSTGGYD